MMVHEDYKELLAARALTALDANDARALDAHLQTCADCRAELIEWEQTAAFLATDAGMQEPSGELRGRILASIGREAQAQSKVLAFKRPLRSVSPWRTMGAIAASLAVVALLVSLIVVWRQNQRTQAELAKLSTQMEAAKSQLERQREAVELLTSPGARMASLSGTNMAPAAHAMIAYDKKGHAMLMAKGLPPTPRGMAYQLWFIVDSKPMPGKVFTTDDQGTGMLSDQMPGEAMAAAVFAITLEPENGVQSPTGKMYLTSG